MQSIYTYININTIFFLNFNFLHIFFVKFIRTVLMDPFKLFIEIGLDEIQFKKI